jgi:hypothetical protein
MEIIITDKIVFVDGVPDLIIDQAASDEHLHSWIDTPLDVNVEGDAYASGADDDEDHRIDAVINYGCVAWE